MTGKLSKNFHGVGIGPLSKILAVKVKFSDTFFRKRFSSIIGLYSDFMFETEKNKFST